jgi:D-alanine-D-alanine ligase
MGKNKNLNVALLLGGTSPEKEVSKSSAASIYSALKNLGYKTVLINPAYGINQPKDENEFFNKEDDKNISNRNYVETINSKLFNNIDLAFIALHGKYGEDGTIQSLLELRGINYTGSKILASSISIDKEMSKILFRHYNINTPEWLTIGKNNFEEDAVKENIAEKLGFPCVIKPNDQGSTVGLTICKSEKEVPAAVKFALQFSDKAIVEKYIPGREVTVAILEDKALPVLEIKPKHGIYDYECKYTAGMSEYIVPAEIPPKIAQQLQSQALLAHTSLGCEVYSRVDFRLNEKLETYCLEVNTLPGMTSTSLVPKMAKAAGISFEQLIKKIIILSLPEGR